MSAAKSAWEHPDTTVITDFQELLDQLMDYRPPYPKQMMIKMSALCSRLKSAGSRLEYSFKEELDELQNELVKLCQDSVLDLEVRLQILEIIELRSFGWTSNRGMEEFYIEKFNDARKAKEITMTSPETSTAGNSNRNPRTPIEQSKGDEANVGVTNDEEEVTKTSLMIGATELSLASKDRRVVQLARQQLETFFSRSSGVQVTGSSGDVASSEVNPPLRRPRRMEVEYVAPEVMRSSLKYSREALLTMANNAHAQVKHKICSIFNVGRLFLLNVTFNLT